MRHNKVKPRFSDFRNILYVVLFLLLPNACSSPLETDVPIVSTKPIAQITNNTSEMEKHPTEEINQSRIKTNCVDIIEQIPENTNLSGVIAIYVTHKGGLLFDIQSRKKINLDSGWGTMTVSPDKSMIGFIDFDMEQLVIADSQGTLIASYPVEENEITAEWIGNEHILLFRTKYDPVTPDPNIVRRVISTAVVFNVFTGERKEIEFDFPNFSMDYSSSPGSRWFALLYSQYNRLVVHPTLDYLLYPTANDPWTGDLVLWDVNAEREISRLFGIYTNTTVPSWSPDGEHFVSTALPYVGVRGSQIWFDTPVRMDDGLFYWGGYELFSMDLEGEKERLTFVSTIGPADFFHYSWSPDGKKIAAWLNIDDGLPGGGRLVVVDIEIGELTDYCIKGHYPIFWSPDGKYLVVSGEDDTTRKDFISVMVVSLNDGWTVKLVEADYSEAAGWMKSP